jgi:hypothetical protein
MWMPVIAGRIARRVLVNFRVDPDTLQRLLPEPFRPKLVHGVAVAGICLIRLEQLRPRGLPRVLGVSSENAAHRIAVEWNDHGALREGVYIPRRDTSSPLNAIAGGRLFPGEHHRASFEVHDSASEVRIDVRSEDGGMRLGLAARPAERLASGSVFASLEEATEFFRGGSFGYSVTTRPGQLDAVELRAPDFALSPLELSWVTSSFFSDPDAFPEGSLELDSALVMRGIEHEWHGHGVLRCGSPARAA